MVRHRWKPKHSKAKREREERRVHRAVADKITFVETVGAVLMGLRDPVDEGERSISEEVAEARTALCDLLWGRWIRARAADLLEQALWTESQGATAASVQHLLETAAHWEWIASISERGQLAWGQRNNRCGRAEGDEDGVDRGAQMRG